jgi:hypothetical protein
VPTYKPNPALGRLAETTDSTPLSVTPAQAGVHFDFASGTSFATDKRARAPSNRTRHSPRAARRRPPLRHPCAGRGPVTLHRVPTSRRINVRARLQTEPGTRHARPDDEPHSPSPSPLRRQGSSDFASGTSFATDNRRCPPSNRTRHSPRAARRRIPSPSPSPLRRQGSSLTLP